MNQLMKDEQEFFDFVEMWNRPAGGDENEKRTTPAGGNVHRVTSAGAPTFLPVKFPHIEKRLLEIVV